jgi:hypothetical protein
MRTWTYGEISKKVLVDLDMQEESFVTPDELVGYFNEAIQEAEAEIHKLGAEDEYFRKSTTFNMTAGQSSYSLNDIAPDLYIRKIRGLVYKDANTNIYGVKRLRRTPGEFVKYMDAVSNATDEDYRYDLANNNSANGMQLVLFPIPRSTGAFLSIWYIRQADRIPLVSEGSQEATDAALIDIPEFINFLMQYVKCRIMAKDLNPLLEGALIILQQQRSLMTDTLTQMIVDDDDLIVPDFSHYWHSS